MRHVLGPWLADRRGAIVGQGWALGQTRAYFRPRRWDQAGRCWVPRVRGPSSVLVADLEVVLLWCLVVLDWSLWAWPRVGISGFRALATAGKHIVGRCVGQRSPAHMAHDVPVAGESAADDGDI